ncbi:SRPBCC family protein [Mycobacteriaceae bacterium NPDC060252]
MASVSVENTINAPYEKVWNLAADYGRWPEWNTMFTKWVGDVPSEIQQGGQVTAVLTIMGMANTIKLTVTEYKAQERVVFSGTGMAGAEITMTFGVEPSDDSTVLTMQADFVSQMMVGAIGSAIERTAKKELSDSLTKFAAIVE